MWSTPSLPLLPGPLRAEVVAPDGVLSMSQRELLDIKTVCKQMTCWIELLEIELFDHLSVCKYCCLIELLMIDSNTWTHLTVYKKLSSSSFKNVINKVCLEIIYI